MIATINKIMKIIIKIVSFLVFSVNCCCSTVSLFCKRTQHMINMRSSYFYLQVSDVLCYKPIPIIYRTSLLQNSLNSYY